MKLEQEVSALKQRSNELATWIKNAQADYEQGKEAVVRVSQELRQVKNDYSAAEKGLKSSTAKLRKKSSASPLKLNRPIVRPISLGKK